MCFLYCYFSPCPATCCVFETFSLPCIECLNFNLSPDHYLFVLWCYVLDLSYTTFFTYYTHICLEFSAVRDFASSILWTIHAHCIPGILLLTLFFIIYILFYSLRRMHSLSLIRSFVPFILPTGTVSNVFFIQRILCHQINHHSIIQILSKLPSIE